LDELLNRPLCEAAEGDVKDQKKDVPVRQKQEGAAATSEGAAATSDEEDGQKKQKKNKKKRLSFTAVVRRDSTDAKGGGTPPETKKTKPLCFTAADSKENRLCFPKSAAVDRLVFFIERVRRHGFTKWFSKVVVRHGPDLASGVYTQLIALVSAAPVSEPLTLAGRIVNLGLGVFILIFVVVFTGATASTLQFAKPASALKSLALTHQAGAKVL
jgi:hypothetical protein